MTIEAFLRRLRMVVKRYGSQLKAARALGVSPAYLNDVLQRRREPGPKLLRPMGIRSRVEYEQARGEDART